MRQISGAIRAHSGFRFDAHPAVEIATEGSVQVAVLRHTNLANASAGVLAAYRRGSVSAIHERSADCAVVLWDGANRTLLLSRDEIGVTPLYHATANDGLVFGTRVADVLAATGEHRRPNRAALAALLVDHGAPTGSATCFEGIAAVPPGCTLVMQNGATTLLPAPPRQPVAAPAAYDEAVERFRVHLQQAVGRRVDDGRTAVLVSGGLDSSAIIALAARSGDVIGITYGPQDGSAADESRFINALQQSGLRIERVPFDPIIDVTSYERNVLEAEVPLADLVPLTLQRAAEAARAHGARALLLGTWGDQVLSPFPPAHLARAWPWQAAAQAADFQRYLADVPVRAVRHALVRQSLRAHAPHWLLRRRQAGRRRTTLFDVLAMDFPGEAVRAAPANFGAAVAHNVRGPAQVQALEGTMKWGMAQGVDARLPYVDPELVRFLTAVPDPIAYDGNRLKPLLRDALAGVVPAAILDRRDKGDYTAAIQRGALPAQVILERFDGLQRLVEHGLMSRAQAIKTLARLGRANDIAEQAATLDSLHAVDTWLRLFFGK